MPGENCAFYGCPTSRSHKLSLFRLPTVAAADGEHSPNAKSPRRMATFDIKNEGADLRRAIFSAELRAIFTYASFILSLNAS